jgi:hypothetical protein
MPPSRVYKSPRDASCQAENKSYKSHKANISLIYFVYIYNRYLNYLSRSPVVYHFHLLLSLLILWATENHYIFGYQRQSDIQIQIQQSCSERGSTILRQMRSRAFATASTLSRPARVPTRHAIDATRRRYA